MRVLVACEFSGIVRNAFVNAGHDAMSCDLLPCETQRPDGWDGHYQGDVRELLADASCEFDLMVAFPPCTHLAVSGARWFKKKHREQAEAIEFVRMLMDCGIPQIAIENPIGILVAVHQKLRSDLGPKGDVRWDKATNRVVSELASLFPSCSLVASRPFANCVTEPFTDVHF